MTALGEQVESAAEGSGLTREDVLRRALLAGIALGVAGPLASIAGAAPQPKRGGTFRIGVSGGSAKDFVDGQDAGTRPDQARLLTGWETLIAFDRRFKLSLDGLAEEITPNTAGNVWTIRVRDGVEFHNGKTLSAADVRYSLQRLTDPRLAKLGLFAGMELSSVDPTRIKQLDRRTIRLTLRRPDATLPEGLAQFVAGIVPVGYSPTSIGQATPNIGTGPYMLESFTPGEKSVHVRNPNYWRTGLPYFDRVVIIDIPDDTARVNALLSGQVDAITDVPPSQAPIVDRGTRTKVLESQSGGWTPLCMRIDMAPFKDLRVRQAFRLIPDRRQMIERGLDGHGSIGNDLYGPFDEDYDRLPQRMQDLDRARSLLKAAGQEGLRVDLYTTGGVRGMNEGAEAFARQAKGAGVTVNLHQLDGVTFYGPNYLKRTFSTDFWGTRNYLAQVAAGSLPTSPYNETHWPPDPRFVSLYKEAVQTVDHPKRREIIRTMMEMEYSAGGYIVWGFSTTLDGYSTRVSGLEAADKDVLPLNSFGHGYRTIWFG